MTSERKSKEAATAERGSIEAGQRVRVDAHRVHLSFPKVAGQLSCEGVRNQRTLWAILDASKHLPFVTEVRDDEIEIASSFYGEGVRTLRVPRQAVKQAGSVGVQLETQGGSV